jgi:hypothetical protein
VKLRTRPSSELDEALQKKSKRNNIGLPDKNKLRLDIQNLQSPLALYSMDHQSILPKSFSLIDASSGLPLHGAFQMMPQNSFLSQHNDMLSVDVNAVQIKPKAKRQKHVCRACVHCKRAHLACDNQRPCRRCVHLGKTDCVDVEHKRRGRPKSTPDKKIDVEKNDLRPKNEVPI